MKLNGKAKEDFIKWTESQSYYTNYSNHNIKYENSERGEFLWYGNEIDLLKESKFLNALIIEWFDSVGIYIKITPEYDGEFYLEMFGLKVLTSGKGLFTDTLFKDRNHATEEAIKKANEIYNKE